MGTQTAGRNGVAPRMLAGTLDLDAMLAERRLDPVPIVLGGHTYTVRRDLRADEINAFNTLLAAGDKDVEAFAVVLGEETEPLVYDQAESEAFNTYVDALPNEHRIFVTQEVVLAAKLRTPDQLPGREMADTAGESKAS